VKECLGSFRATSKVWYLGKAYVLGGALARNNGKHNLGIDTSGGDVNNLFRHVKRHY
jgi:hypothetical protein